MAQSRHPRGKVLAARGAVVDVAFDAAELPRLDEALIVEWDRPETLMLEVQAHLDDRTVRGVALQATAGLKRGVPVRPTGRPITVPVGDCVLGRLLDVTGNIRDNGSPLPAELSRMPIHRTAPPLGDRSPATAIFETGIMYPAVDPLSSSSILLDPTVVGEEHYRIAEQVRETIAHYKELQDIISLLGIEELSARDRLIVTRARRLQRFLTQPFAVTEAFTGKPGRSVPLVDTLKGCGTILDGTCDKWAESSLYMVGTIGEAREKENALNREAISS